MKTIKAWALFKDGKPKIDSIYKSKKKALTIAKSFPYRYDFAAPITISYNPEDIK